ncbi:MAG TPA: histidine phosphatase family protein [Acidisarcina sp.]|nr:histidine phosphatase family protein [Acidisarcina sp.]
MNLYVLRHASAGTRRINPKLDVKRPLDRDGKQQCMMLGRYLNALNLQFDVIASSPLKRSLQTASMVGTETGYEAKVMVAEALSPSATFASFKQLLDELSHYENVLVVGHNPNLQNFLSALVGLNGRTCFRLRKAGMARLDCTRRPATMFWMVEPRLLRSIYTSVTKSSRRKTSRK